MQVPPQGETKLVENADEEDEEKEKVEEEVDKDEESLCCICLVNKADSAPIPCGHLCGCQSCLELVMRSSRNNCPICRARIEGIQRVHWSVAPSSFKSTSQAVAEPFKSYGVSRRDARRALDEVGNDIAAAGRRLVQLAVQHAEVNMEGLVAKIVAAREDNDCKDVVDTMREGLYSEVVVGKGLEAVVLLCENYFTQSQISPGMRVRCRWKSMSGSFYSATIASLNNDGTYVIHYEDGDQDASVSLNRLSNNEMPRIFEESGGIPLLVEMLEEHGETSAEVAKNGLGVLKNLSTNDDIKKRIAEADGIVMILRMIEVHGASDAVVAKNGCGALKSLALGNADNKKRIGEAGGIAMILRMLDVHGESNAEVAKNGCGALMNLAINADNKKRIGEAGGIAMILSMLDVHGESNAGVANNGCGALMNLAANNADNKSKILAANGVSMVERMKSTWASNEGVKTNANDALQNLRYM